MELNKCVIIVPIYKLEFNEDEYQSIKQLFNILGKYHIIAICPESLDISYYQNNFDFYDYCVLCDMYFQDFPIGYNKLMLNSGFYKLFENYEYMLIYQPDAWVFKDELEYWCNQGYDYIGGALFWFSANELYSKTELCGNGGLSLRNISWWIENCNKYDKYKDIFIKDGEDRFPTYINSWENAKIANLPPLDVLKKFSWDIDPEINYVMLNKLPFGCHKYKGVKHAYIYDKIILYDNKKLYTFITFIFDNSQLYDPIDIDPLAKYICVTNRHDLKSNIWQFVYDDEINNGDYTNEQRKLIAKYKALNYCNTDICISIDNDIQILGFIFKYIYIFMIRNFDICVMINPNNDSYIEEFNRCFCLEQKYIDFYKFMSTNNYDLTEHGLLMTKFCIQRNNDINKKLNKEILDLIINENLDIINVDQLYFTSIFLEKYFENMNTTFLCYQTLCSKYFLDHHYNYDHTFDLREKKYYKIKNIDMPSEYFI